MEENERNDKSKWRKPGSRRTIKAARSGSIQTSPRRCLLLWPPAALSSPPPLRHFQTRTRDQRKPRNEFRPEALHPNNLISFKQLRCRLWGRGGERRVVEGGRGWKWVEVGGATSRERIPRQCLLLLCG